MKGLVALALAGLAVLGVAPSLAATYSGPMYGTNEVPPNASPATGLTVIEITGNTMLVHVEWSGLIGGPASAAHIHCCTDPGNAIGVAVGLAGFPALSAGIYDQSFDLLDSGIYNAAYLAGFGGGTAAGARDALIAALDAGRAYTNIHNSTFPGGEIRANLVPGLVPETATWLLMIATFGALGLAMRRRRRVSGASPS